MDLRSLELAEFSKEYEGYLLKKYGARLQNLNGKQLKEQLDNLDKCKKDPAMLQKLQDYLIKLAA